MSYRKIAFICVLGVVAFSLSACGKKEQKPQVSPAPIMPQVQNEIPQNSLPLSGGAVNDPVIAPPKNNSDIQEALKKLNTSNSANSLEVNEADYVVEAEVVDASVKADTETSAVSKDVDF